MDEFVPFFALPVAETPSAAQSSNGREFHPMAPPPSPTPPTGAAGDAAHPHKPVVKLVRDGDRVKQIRIQCSCGQIIELDCVY
jgi:hypothetical protein